MKKYLDKDGLQEYTEKLTNKYKTMFGSASITSVDNFGAKGDGTTNDTRAWQEAIDSGLHIIANPNATYLVDQLNVTKNITIDCNGCNFIVRSNILFNCSGQMSGSAEGQPTYSYGVYDYSIINPEYVNYTGMAMLTSKTKLYADAPTYYQGVVAEFKNGRLTETFPLDITDPTIKFYNPITVKIKNIGDITHLRSSTATRGIVIKNGNNCLVEGLDTNSNCYSTIEINESCNVKIRDCNIKNVFESSTNNSYAVSVGSSSHTTIENCKMYNRFWHCVSTGGYNPAYVVYDTTILNCVLHSEALYAYLDHHNAVKTSIVGGIYTGIGINAPALVRDCQIDTLNDTYKILQLRAQAAFDERFAKFVFENIQFIAAGDKTTAYAGIRLMSNGGPEKYFREVNIKNIDAEGKFSSSAGINFFVDPSAGTVHYKDLYIDNCNIPIHGKIDANNTLIDVANLNYYISNCRNLKLGGSSFKEVMNNAYVTNCQFTYCRGIFTKLYLNNCELGAVVSDITELFGSNIRGTIANAILTKITRLSISNMSTATLVTGFNISRGNDGKYYRQKLVNGVYTTEEITSE